jgi:putative hydrolase of the HAD superfamily
VVTAVWCDFGGVITSPVPEAFDRLARAAEVPAGVLLAAIDRVAADFGLTMLDPLELGLLAQDDWGRRVSAVLAPDWAPALDLSRFGDYWYIDRQVNTPLLDALAALRRAGVRVGMLTNSVREWEPHRRALVPDVGAFEFTINSFEVGLRKPDPAIYQLAEETFATPAERCLLIDDLTVNCAAARVRGWQTIEHQALPDTLTQLARLVPVRS